MAKHLFTFILFVGLFTAACSPKPEPFSKKDLAHAVYNSLKANDFNAYEKRFSNHDDVKYHFHNLIAYSNKRLKNKKAKKVLQINVKKALSKFPARRVKRVKKLKNEFHALREKLDRHSVNWTQLKLTGIHIERASTMYNMPVADIILNLTDNNKFFVIRLPMCIKVQRGWIFTEGMRWEGASKPLLKKKTANTVKPSRQQP
jgi:hypothetical protein